MGANQTTGVCVSVEAELAVYDSMPAELRRVINQAPYDYEVSSWRRDWRKAQARGGSLQSFREYMIRVILRDRDKEIAEVWGVDHPMYRQRPKGWQE